MIVETVFDRQQDACHAHQGILGRRFAVGDDLRQRLNFILHPLAQLSQAEHAQRVADFLQQLQLRNQFGALAAAPAHEDVEHILHLRQVFLDGGRHGAHQFDAGRGQAFTFVFDGVVDGQKLGQFERGPHGADAAAAGGRARDVVQQIVEQIDRRILAVASLAEFIQRLDLPVRLAQQPLQGRAAFESVGPHRFEDGAGDPPQLEHRLGGRDLLQLLGHFRQNFQILNRAFAADVSQQADLNRGRKRRAHCATEIDCSPWVSCGLAF